MDFNLRQWEAEEKIGFCLSDLSLAMWREQIGVGKVGRRETRRSEYTEVTHGDHRTWGWKLSQGPEFSVS